MSPEPEVTPTPRCRLCGCTEHQACAGGCEWIDFDAQICSACVGTGSAETVAIVRQIAEGVAMGGEHQASQGNMAAAIQARLMATIIAGLGEVYAVIEAMRVEHAKIRAKRENPEARQNVWCGPGEDEDCSYVADSYLIELDPVLSRLRELAVEALPVAPPSGLVDARGMPVSSPGGLAPEGSHGGDPPRVG